MAGLFGTGIPNPLKPFTDAYSKPYDDATRANKQAAADTQQIGQNAVGMGQAGISRALQQTDPAARYFHNNWEGQGALAGPGQAEQRYQNQLNGSDVFANYQRAEGGRDLSNAFSARSLNNSGAAMRAHALMGAKIDADSQGRMDALAGQAQNATESRLGGAFDRLNSMGTNRAGIVERGTQGTIDSYTAGQLGGTNGRLAAANVGVGERKDTMKLFGDAGGYAAGKFL
jgi:hypothetical protein